MIGTGTEEIAPDGDITWEKRAESVMAREIGSFAIVSKNVGHVLTL